MHISGQHGIEAGALELDQPEIALILRPVFGKNFIVKGHIVNVLCSVNHKISFTSIQLHICVK